MLIRLCGQTSLRHSPQSSRQQLLESFKSFSFSMNNRGGLPTPPTPTSHSPNENAGFRRALEQSRMTQRPQQPKATDDLFSPSQQEQQPPSNGFFNSPFLSSTPKPTTNGRYKIPPPLPLRLGKKDVARPVGKVEPGQGLMALPSPVVKTLRGEANGGYPSANISPGSKSLPDSPDRNPNDVKRSIQESVLKHEAENAYHQIRTKRPPTPPHSPTSNNKTSHTQGHLLSPPIVTPLSPETPDRAATRLPKTIKEEEVVLRMDNDQQDAAPEFSVAQKVLAEHPLDPGFLELYEIRDELGSGGFGFVCSAWSRVENVEVAVKFIYKNKLHQRAVVKDWHRRESAPGILHRDRGGASGYRLIPMEAAILQFVQHPGIVNFKGLFEDSTFFYLVCEAGSLLDFDALIRFGLAYRRSKNCTARPGPNTPHPSRCNTPPSWDLTLPARTSKPLLNLLAPCLCPHLPPLSTRRPPRWMHRLRLRASAIRLTPALRTILIAGDLLLILVWVRLPLGLP
jgi:hypothetical protein